LNQKFFQLKTYIAYWLNAVDAHSIHSPFFFDMYTKVIQYHSPDQTLDNLEAYRKELLNSEETLTIEDLGSGSRHFESTLRKVRTIARSSLSPEKFSLLYRRIIHYFKAKYILELGTSLGINTLYLGWRTDAFINTLEGSPALARIAQHLFDRAGCANNNIIAGNIDDTLSHALSGMQRVDFALLDANHLHAPTLRYFEVISAKVHDQSIVVVDDIHYSSEMERAWREIQLHPKVYGTADLYRCGIVFFDPSLAKQHFVLQF
jgi:predicted O-methyltransferase YrrM